MHFHWFLLQSNSLVVHYRLQERRPMNKMASVSFFPRVFEVLMKRRLRDYVEMDIYLIRVT